MARAGRGTNQNGARAALFLLIGAAGCVPIDGGSIEASWVLRTFDGRAIEGCGCAAPAVARVAVCAVPPDAPGGSASCGDPAYDVCATNPGCSFPCDRQTGATPFFVASGRWALSLVALDAAGNRLSSPDVGAGGSIVVPAPILRDAVKGQVTELPALQVKAECAMQCSAGETAACKPR